MKPCESETTLNYIGYSIPLLDSTAEAARKLFDLNVFALIAVTQAFAPLLIASKGTVINIGSIAGIAPMPWEGYYHATKAAVGILSDTLRMEMSPFDVKVINVVTGGVKTKFFANIPNQKLPPNSLYAAAREDIEPIMNGAIIADSGWDADTYAKDVVSNALKSSPKLHVWKGSGAWAVWFVDTFGWATIWVCHLNYVVSSLMISRTLSSRTWSNFLALPRKYVVHRSRSEGLFIRAGASPAFWFTVRCEKLSRNSSTNFNMN